MKIYPKEFKDQLIQEETGSVPQVARRHEISSKTLYRWIKESKHKAWEETPDYLPEGSSLLTSLSYIVKLDMVLMEFHPHKKKLLIVNGYATI